MEARSTSTEKLSFELKYCERCGGLWLRPMGGEQIYCVACGRAMAELPQTWEEQESANADEVFGEVRGARFEECEGEQDEAGGLA